MGVGRSAALLTRAGGARGRRPPREVLPADSVRASAQRLLRVHPLRAADSLQLAAALLACEQDPPSLELVCLDDRLAEAAGREGFPVVP